MLLKFSSASRTRPRYFRHSPFSNFTKHSSSTEYSFSDNKEWGKKPGLFISATVTHGAPTLLDPGDTEVTHMVPNSGSSHLGRKDRYWDDDNTARPGLTAGSPGAMGAQRRPWPYLGDKGQLGRAASAAQSRKAKVSYQVREVRKDIFGRENLQL